MSTVRDFPLFSIFIWFLHISQIVITTGASCVGRLLKNSNLQVLNIGGNSIGDSDISVMMDGLQHNKTLTKLYVYECGLSAKGTI